MKIAIDLTWVKPKKSGGVQSFSENLINGLIKLPDDNVYILLLAKDNYEYFTHYFENQKIRKIVCNTKAFHVISHLLWQNLCLYRILKNHHITFCYFPVYEKAPIYKSKKIKTVATIHDIRAYHYPKDFSKMENIWLRFA